MMRGSAVVLLVLSYLAFVSLGLPDTVLGVAWPSIRARFDVSQAGLGLVLATGVAGYFLSGLMAGGLVARMGTGGLLAVSTALVAVGLVGYVAAPSWSLFLPGAAVIGLGSGAIDGALNGYAARSFPARHLNWLHACWSVGATLGPMIMTTVLVRGSTFRVGYAVIAAVLAAMATAFLFTRRRWRLEPAAALPSAPAEPMSSGWGTLRRGRVWLQIVTFFVYSGVEAGAGQWCFTVLREARGLTVEAAGAWTTVYWGSLLMGRVALGFVIDRLGPDRVLRGATIAAVLGATIFAAHGGAFGRLGLALLGAALAPLYPTLMARTPARLGPQATPYAVGFQVSAATLGTAAVPAALGLGVATVGPAIVPFAVLAAAVVLLGLHEALLRATARARP